MQLLTRHMIFVDEGGRSEEIKGPGAKGAMPELEPGQSWSYTSQTRLRTPRGSMHGWFTFETFAGMEEAALWHPEGVKAFSAALGRLALSSTGRASELVPCALPGDEGLLLGTSVHRTERVFVGAVVALLSQDEDVGRYRYAVDVQINNAGSVSVFVVGYRWELIDKHGQRYRKQERGLGQQNGKELSAIKLPPGSAMRLKCEMPSVHTTTATIRGETTRALKALDSSCIHQSVCPPSSQVPSSPSSCTLMQNPTASRCRARTRAKSLNWSSHHSARRQMVRPSLSTFPWAFLASDGMASCHRALEAIGA